MKATITKIENGQVWAKSLERKVLQVTIDDIMYPQLRLPKKIFELQVHPDDLVFKNDYGIEIFKGWELGQQIIVKIENGYFRIINNN